jgi:hypothetical protein
VVLDIWADALVLLTRKNFQDEEEELDLADVTTFTMVTLFLARNEGVPVAELRDMIQHIATAELVQPDAWSSWVESHGDPAERIFARLTDLGAAQVSEGIARLTPLGQYTYAGALTEGGVEVPLLPPVEEMTAVDLMDFARGASDDDMAAETDAWLAARGKAAATDELLTAAAAGDAEERMIAIAIAGPIAAAAPDRWRQALDEPALRPYAKLTLHQLGAAGPELESTVTDAAWLLTDMLGAALAMDSGDQDELPDILAGAVPAGQEPKIFEAIWRLDHPNAREVLTMIGAQHPDKKIAKAALKIRPST